MPDISFTALIPWIIAHGYGVFFLIALVEGPIITMAAGAACALGYFNVYIIIFLALLGDIGADVLYYAVGYYGGHIIRPWLSPSIGLHKNRFEHIQALIHTHARKAVALVKLSPIGAISISGLVIIGMARMKFKKFMEAGLIISLPKSIFLVALGYYSGQAYVHLGSRVAHASYILAGIALLVLAIFQGYNKITGKIYEKIEEESEIMEEEKIIYLTFDDGPQEPYTSEILSALEQYNAKATFFVCGKNIERETATLQKIINAGHAIGNHTYSHNLFKALTGNMLSEIIKTEEIIKKYAGTEAKLYRSPWGITMPWLRWMLKKKHYKIYHWDIWALDWNQPSTEYIANRVITEAFPGAIVLLHDGNQTMTGSRENTSKAVPIILDALKKQGYVFRSLS